MVAWLLSRGIGRWIGGGLMSSWLLRCCIRRGLRCGWLIWMVRIGRGWLRG